MLRPTIRWGTKRPTILLEFMLYALVGYTFIVGIWLLPSYHLSYGYFVDPPPNAVLGDVPGWDLDGVCSGLQALNAGHDPYLESKPWPMTYALIHAYLFKPLCAVEAGNPVVYAILYVLIAAACAIMLWRLVPPTALDRIAVFGAIFLSFDAFKFVLITGNVVILELPLAVAMLLLLAKRQHAWAGFTFGSMASLKLMPIIGIIAFLFLPESSRSRLESIVSACVAFVGIHVMNWALFTRWFPSYAAELTGRIPGGPSFGNEPNQGTIESVIAWLSKLGFVRPLPESALAFLALAVGCLVTVACARKTAERDELPPVAVVSLVILVLWLFLFRQKEYAFETFIPFLIVAAYGAGREIGILAIVASVLIPAVAWRHAELGLIPYYQLAGAWAAVLITMVGAIIKLRWARVDWRVSGAETRG
jgi:hypothetical protein